MKRLWGAMAALILATAPVVATDYPSRQITILVPAPAGGPTDTFGRLLADAMGRLYGQRILVENAVGAGGMVGARRVARAAPDGYTLLVFNTALTSIPAFSKTIELDPLTGLSPIGLINESPFVLLSRRDFPAADTRELVARMRADNDNIRFGHGGFGGGAHICGLLLSRAVGAKPNFVAYRGAAPVMTDIMGGHIDLFCAQTADAIANAETKTIKPFALTGTTRLAQLPQISTLREAGVQDADMSVWHALFAPPGTPDDVLSSLSGALDRALEDPEIIARFKMLGVQATEPARRGPAMLRKLLEVETMRWRTLVSDMGVTQQ
ncbi:Bug family tripartite tricarboxylate transporter substrate binding protein [Bosea lathyri]|uniref:Tripartite-type tricarboxylate transporter, receptor component TctC n=1 Tax=Bosea lathyri TaxID=1036778 RepID=A0A1H6CPN8_9HYPH|nr:tripartite tricarboxylate transporter substrate-binding protein [Bosea lathyri]SEG74954.1 Tripartite-type tricarboxylate transporter, receptor component TctC [Bosea lathyri]